MGLIQFAKNVGRKLGLGDDEAPKPAAPAAQGPTPQEVRALNDRRKAAALVKLIEGMGFKVDELGVRVDDDKVTLTGTARSQEEREKVVLLAGNNEGIGSVDDKMTVSEPAPEAVYYEVQKGDTLSKIAKQHYGDANKYHQIFEANKPMLEDPDKIYPGQRLRIPGATHA